MSRQPLAGFVAERLSKYLEVSVDDPMREENLRVEVQFCPPSVDGGSNVSMQFGDSPNLITPVPCVDELLKEEDDGKEGEERSEQVPGDPRLPS